MVNQWFKEVIDLEDAAWLQTLPGSGTAALGLVGEADAPCVVIC